MAYQFILVLYFGLSFSHRICDAQSTWTTNNTETIQTNASLELVAEPLYLTPLIEAGDLQKAKLLSEVHLDSFNVTSFSGLITTNMEATTHMFFWFFPTANENLAAPLLIWLGGGGCGSSSLESIFGDSGPYAVTKDSELEPRKSDWTSTNNVLYLDALIGSGFSSTKSDSDYAKDSSDVAQQLYKCVLQFFAIFPEQQKNNIYIVGKSYAGKFAQSLAYYIQLESNQSPMATHLKGIILLSGLMEPLMDLTPANYLYQVGLVNEKQVMHMKELTDFAAKAIQADAYDEASNILEEQSRYFESVTGLKTDLDIISGRPHPEIYDNAQNLANSSIFRNAIHVGSLKFNSLSVDRQARIMLEDQFKSYDSHLEFLLDNNYHVIMLGGQFDAKYNPAVTDQAIGQLNWKWTKDYFGAPRKVFRNKRGEIYGYVTTLHNLCYVTLRQAAHYVTVDQPEAVLKAVNAFIRNDTF